MPESVLSAEQWLPGGGEMGERIRMFDWSRTPLGPIEQWPQSLRTAASICLSSKFPMVIWWGPELTLLYNDGWRPILGENKDRRALGSPGREVWPEIWDVIGPMFESVMTKGQATWSDDGLLLVNRYGYTEEAYFTWSYSPIRDESGGVGGIFTAVTETTERVIGERRMQALRDLAACGVQARDIEATCHSIAEALAGHPYEFPFALLYWISDDRQEVHLASRSGITAETSASPRVLDLQADLAKAWPLAEVARTGQAAMVSNLAEKFVDLPASVWQESPREAMVLPVMLPGQTLPSLLLVLAVSPRQQLDDECRNFFNLVAGQIAATIADAQAYEQERKRAEALAEIDRAKTAFFSNVSHEFRTPLTLMLGPLEDALSNRDWLNQQAQEQIEIAHRNGMRLLKLVNTLLDFSRIEAGRVDAVYEPTDLARFTAELASVFRSATEKAGLKLIVDCPPLDEPIYVDREMWEKIVLNLISNAFKFTFNGEIEVKLCLTGNTARLMVRDTGTGIPAEELPHLFERFHRVKGAKGRSIEGSGIGLSLVRELARLHGGDVSVESKPNEGSTFTVTIPVGTAHLPAEHIGRERTRVSTALGADAYIEEALRWLPEESFLNKPISMGDRPVPSIAQNNGSEASGLSRILLADDNADMREYVRRLLGESYEVVAVADGQAALEATHEYCFDLVLTDVMMPRLDGFGLLKALRTDERTRNIPVIMLSARAGEESRVEGLEAGADDYLIKPFSARELLARVESNLKLARLRHESLVREQSLRVEAEEARHRLENVLASINDQFIVLNREWRYTYINDRVVQVTGLRKEELLGQSIWDLFPDLVDTPFFDEARKAAAQQEPRHLEFYYPGWDRWLENRIYPSPDNFTVLVTDVSDRKRAEIERDKLFVQEQAARQQAEAANRLKDEFLATVSHELRTPLNAILGWIVLLRSGRLTPEKVAEALATVERNARAQNRLIEDLLDVSRIITGKLRLELQPVTIAQVAEAAIASARPAAEAKGILLVSDCDLTGIVQGDADRLQQVVWNLVSNAIKFTPEGGSVMVRLVQDNGQVKLTVSDTGEGIAPEFLPHVFHRFSQADGSYKRKHGGLGLGLAIVRHLVELHGGKVGVESQGVGQGTTFTVTLPLRKTNSGAHNGHDDATLDSPFYNTFRTESARATPRLDEIKVLVVDDEEDSRNMVAALLVESGVEIRTAGSAAEAIDVLAKWRPDVLVVDIGMPGEDGYEFIRRIRKNESASGFKEIPAVALTAYARSEDRLNALAAGYQQHLAKPVEPAELLVVVASLTGRLIR